MLLVVILVGGPLLVTQQAENRKKASSNGARSAPAQALLSELALRVDGAVGDAAWRRGYRDVAVRLEDASPIGALALGPEACGAPVIVAVGAASSDGELAANRRLARLRARWLAQWAAAQVASCPAAQRPAVLAASLGQAPEEPAAAEQRRVRLLVQAAGEEQASETALRQVLSAQLHVPLERLEICAPPHSGAALPACH